MIINAPLHFCLFSVFQDMSTKAFASKVQRDPLFAKRFSPTFNLNDRFIELTFYGHKISTKVFRFFSILRDVDLSAILLFLFCRSFFFVVVARFVILLRTQRRCCDQTPTPIRAFSLLYLLYSFLFVNDSNSSERNKKSHTHKNKKK